MPVILSGQDKFEDTITSVKAKFGDIIRQIPLLRLLPYFSNKSKPKLKFTLFLYDPKGKFSIRDVYITRGTYIEGTLADYEPHSMEYRDAGIEWSIKQIQLGKEYSVQLSMITEIGTHQYYVLAPLYYTDEKGVNRDIYQSITLMNTGNIQSAENWFIKIAYGVIGAIIGGIMSYLITLLA